MRTKKKVWSELRAIAKSEPGSTEAETEKGMAIAALAAAYRFLLKKMRKNSGLGGKVPRRGKMTMDKESSP